MTQARGSRRLGNVAAAGLLVSMAVVGLLPAAKADLKGTCEKAVEAGVCNVSALLRTEGECAQFEPWKGACQGSPPSCASFLPTAPCAGDLVGTCREAVARLPGFVDQDAIDSLCTMDGGEQCRRAVALLQERLSSGLAENGPPAGAFGPELNCPFADALPEDPFENVPPLPDAEQHVADTAQYLMEGPTGHEPGVCEATAVPVTDVIVGNGGSTFQLFQVPGTPSQRTAVYGSWSLVTNNLNNGADRWAFGWELRGNSGAVQDTGVVDKRGGTCVYLGHANQNFQYFIDAGAGGWSTSTQCTITFSWEVTIGVQFTATGPQGGGSATMGGSVSCGSGAVFDSESLLRDVGFASPLICGLPCIT
jgi:hypothetical protein